MYINIKLWNPNLFTICLYTNTSRNELISLLAETCDGQNGQEQGWKNQQKRIFAVEIQEHMKYQIRLSKKIFLWWELKMHRRPYVHNSIYREKNIDIL